MAVRRSETVRRSIALPGDLVQQALALAPPQAAGNLNRLVAVCLREFIARRKREAFEAAMAEMAADPAVRRECSAIETELACAENDGLSRD
jgi:hypothetical protein